MEKENAAFREEKNALQSYLHDADRIIAEKESQLQAHAIPSPDSFDTDAVFQEISPAYAAERNLFKSITEIKATLGSPYFKRFDMHCEGETKVIYVGNQPIEFDQHIVFQWQEAGEKPMLDFLMRGPEQPYFSDRDGRIHERLLERRIAIEESNLVDVDDERISDSIFAQLGINDPFLVNVIKRRREEDLAIANIISTVQRNQYEIIRYPVDESFIVQGCAGSGKTYIMLNRLSYLLFNNKVFGLSPKDVIIISPNPRVQYQLANVIIDLNIEAVHQTTIEQWYLEMLRQYSLRFDNSIIYTESSLPQEYENEVFNQSFLDRISDSIRIEREIILEQARTLINDPVIRSWAQIRSIVLNKHERLSDLITFIRLVEKEARRIEKEFHNHCEANDISENSLDSSIQDNRKLDQRLKEINKIDAQISEMLSYDPLFEEYRAAEELLAEENETFNQNKKEAETRLQNSLKKIRDIDSVSAEERTTILTKHLHLEVDSRAFEKDGRSTLLHLSNVSECRLLMDESWTEIVQKLPFKYHTSAEAAQNAIRDDFNALLRRKAELEENLENNVNIADQKRMLRNRAIELGSAMMPSERMKTLSEFMRRAGNLPVRARDISAGILKELKQKYAVPLLVDNSNASSENNKSPQKHALFRSDLFIFLLATARISEDTYTLPWKLMCFDEGQDVSCFEYEFIHKLTGGKTRLNIFGDVRQGRIGSKSSIHNWETTFPEYAIFHLNENYRNAQQITERMNQHFSTNMLAIGVDGLVEEANQWNRKQIFQRFLQKNTKGWIVVRNRETFDSFIASIGTKDSFPLLSYDIEKSENSFVVLTIDQIKGLEFPRVLVVTDNMDSNQKYISMTRALSELYIV